MLSEEDGEGGEDGVNDNEAPGADSHPECGSNIDVKFLGVVSQKLLEVDVISNLLAIEIEDSDGNSEEDADEEGEWGERVDEVFLEAAGARGEEVPDKCDYLEGECGDHTDGDDFLIRLHFLPERGTSGDIVLTEEWNDSSETLRMIGLNIVVHCQNIRFQSSPLVGERGSESESDGSEHDDSKNKLCQRRAHD